MARKGGRSGVREPVQVYLEPADRELLEEAARRTGLARAEILRRGLRNVAQQLLAERRPGSSLEYLIGVLGDDPSIPRDLAEKHDEYLYGALSDE
ncbi:MAG: hypothetical protein ACREKB_13005, partial [Candidatus Rokuibacteriota bacterium]